LKDGRIQLIENGQKWSEMNFVDGNVHGLSTTWYENGQKAFEHNYVDGKYITGGAG
jgi:antitoxin component YwqK of YwqJK toxin-antitoxin module